MKKAHIDNQNKLLGWYDSEIHTLIPTPNIEVTEDKWLIAIANNHNKINADGTTELVEIPKTEEELEAEAKQAKTLALSTLTVTTSQGNTFDGNETARNNMMSAILSAELVGKIEDEWKLADNTKVIVTLDELKEALALSIQKVGEIVRG